MHAKCISDCYSLVQGLEDSHTATSATAGIRRTEQRAHGQASSWDKEYLALRQSPVESSASFMRMTKKLLLAIREVLRVCPWNQLALNFWIFTFSQQSEENNELNTKLETGRLVSNFLSENKEIGEITTIISVLTPANEKLTQMHEFWKFQTYSYKATSTNLFSLKTSVMKNNVKRSYKQQATGMPLEKEALKTNLSVEKNCCYMIS